jgi:hypothetical protein
LNNETLRVISLSALDAAFDKSLCGRIDRSVNVRYKDRLSEYETGEKKNECYEEESQLYAALHNWPMSYGCLSLRSRIPKPPHTNKTAIAETNQERSFLTAKPGGTSNATAFSNASGSFAFFIVNSR